jgi:hypothetical protein
MSSLWNVAKTCCTPDRFVYELYGLTEEEIALVEGKLSVE